MVRVEEGSPAVMLRGMAGAQLGVWCAHGEGRAHFPDAAVRARVEAEALAPIRWAQAQALRWLGPLLFCEVFVLVLLCPRDAGLGAVDWGSRQHCRNAGWVEARQPCRGADVRRLVPPRTAGTATPRARPPSSTPSTPTASPAGIAALCSPDGRHLAMMPHPERCFLAWQLPWYPRGMEGLEAACPGPWLKLFQNAREWCEAQA